MAHRRKLENLAAGGQDRDRETSRSFERLCEKLLQKSEELVQAKFDLSASEERCQQQVAENGRLNNLVSQLQEAPIEAL